MRLLLRGVHRLSLLLACWSASQLRMGTRLVEGLVWADHVMVGEVIPLTLSLTTRPSFYGAQQFIPSIGNCYSSPECSSSCEAALLQGCGLVC